MAGIGSAEISRRCTIFNARDTTVNVYLDLDLGGMGMISGGLLLFLLFFVRVLFIGRFGDAKEFSSRNGSFRNDSPDTVVQLN